MEDPQPFLGGLRNRTMVLDETIAYPTPQNC